MLFNYITNIIGEDLTDVYEKYAHQEGTNKFNFPIPKKTWTYNFMSGHVLWFDSESGEVEAPNKTIALEMAKEIIKKHFDEINKCLDGFDVINYDLSHFEVTEK